MKKLLFILVVVCAGAVNTALAQLKPTTVAEVLGGDSYSNYDHEGMAMLVNKDGVAVFSPAYCYENGTDLEVTIFGEKFSVLEKFTIHNCISDIDAHQDGIDLESAGLSTIVVTKNFFVKNDKWCVTITDKYYDGQYYVLDEDGNNLGAIKENPEDKIKFYLDGMYQGPASSCRSRQHRRG